MLLLHCCDTYYLYAKKAALSQVVPTWMICFTLPFNLHPIWAVVPFATLFALMASTFKRHLQGANAGHSGNNVLIAVMRIDTIRI